MIDRENFDRPNSTIKGPNPVHDIFRLLDWGTPHVQILAQLESWERKQISYTKSIQRGSESEKRVQNAICSLQGVGKTVISRRFSNLDRQMVDILVHLREPYSLDFAGIQVKSSQSGINRVFERLQRQLNLDLDQTKLWVQERRLLFIDGQASREQIRTEFQTQLAAIEARSNFQPERGSRVQPKKPTQILNDLKKQHRAIVYTILEYDEETDAGEKSRQGTLVARLFNGEEITLRVSGINKERVKQSAAQQLLEYLQSIGLISE